MRKPRRISRKSSKKSFTKNARRVNGKNRSAPGLMRGGYRL